ncbi:MAG: phytanoyl-CoA dioxygenase family protein [Phycisphaeraceae bacterium]
MTTAPTATATSAPPSRKFSDLPGQTDSTGITERDKYFFDLNGFLVLKGAIDKDHLAQINARLDEFLAMDPPIKPNEWIGAVHGHNYTGNEGLNLQQIYEAGEPFERLIDHPAWIDKAKHFVGGQDNFDAHHGPLFIDENFASIRGPGEAIGMHSGGEKLVKRCQYRYENGQFSCGQVNALMAFNDVGPGDGATMVIPGSHKANFEHPQLQWASMQAGKSSMDEVEGAVEAHLEAGDVLLFVDAIMHGSAARVNEGQRRIAVYRYGPSWGMFRSGYRPSQELLDRLTPERRAIVWPHEAMKREPNRIPGYPNPAEADGIDKS